MKIFSLIAFASLFVISSLGQSPTPSPSPVDDVVKITTSVIQVDVTVTDKKGNIVRDLKPGDVEVYENGKRQEITGLTLVSGPQRTVDGGSKIEKGLSVQTTLPSGPVKPENVRRTIAVVVDDLSLSFASIFWVKNALRKYVREQINDGDLVAIIRTAGGIGALQQFTTDKRQLMAAIEKVKYSAYSSGGVSSFEPITPSLKDQMAGPRKGSKDLTPEADAERNAERKANESRSSVFASGTLGAVNFIVRGMQTLPGRKSIVLLSDGIPLVGRDDQGRQKGSTIVMERMRQLVELANRASVVIYSIDARGLETPGPQAMDDWTATGFEARLRQREQAFSDSQDGLRYLAAETGGMAFVNQNDINHGLGKVMDDQSYYLIAYEPDSSTFDPKASRFNKLEVKVNRPDIKVRYRSGFFGITDEQLERSKPMGGAATINALVSPFAVNDIPVRLQTLFSADEKDNAWLKSYLHIDAKQLKFTQAEGNTWRTSFEIVAFSYGDNGMPSDQIAKQFTLTIQDFAYKRSLEKGIVYQFAFPAKKPGAYQYRVAIRDTATNKVGSAVQFVEVPTLKKNRVVLSGAVLQSVSRSDWQKFSQGSITAETLTMRTDPETDTALRQFRQGDVMRFAVAIYNVKAAKPSALRAKIQIYKDGKLHFDGQPNTVKIDPAQFSAEYVGGMILGKDMSPGDYVMQIEVFDENSNDRPVTQFVQFEIVE